MSGQKVAKGYKQTEVGVIPEDWGIATAAEVCDLVVDCKNRTPPIVEGGEFAVVRTPNVRNGRFVLEELRFTDASSFREWTARAVPQVGDILITREAPLGEVCLVPKDYKVCLGQRMMLYRPDKNKIDSAFFLYSLMAPAVQSCLMKKIGGSTVGHAKVDDIRNLEIPIPPTIEEQKLIARALSDIDALIEGLEGTIGKKRHIKQGAMQELLTGRRRLPGFNSDWQNKSFGEIFDYRSTATNSRSDLTSDGDTYYIHYGDIHTRFHSHLDFRRNQPPKIKRQLCENATLLQNGDWIMADASEDYDGVGKSIEILGLDSSVAAVAGLHTFVLREKTDTFSPGFKGHLGNLKSLHDEFLRVTTGMKVFGISKTALRDLILPVPSREEQTAIATILSDMDTEIATLEAKLAKTRQLKQGMMHELLTGRIRLV